MRTIAIIGGGFSGSILAAQLLRRGRKALRVHLIERSGRPGPGLAYGTAHPSHLLNVPAGRMSALAEDPDHFLRWAQRSWPGTGPESFLPRHIYGEYVSETLAEARRLSPTALETHAGEVSDLREAVGSFRVQIEGRGSLAADHVVLAMGNSPAGIPFELDAAAAEHPGFVADYWSGRERPISPDASILIVGTGLAMVDAVLELAAKRHRGSILAVSRHGLVSSPHALPFRSYPFFLTPFPTTARSLVRLMRREIESAESNGFHWQAVLDCLRPRTNAIWSRLPLEEKKRFLRHARSYWDAHRHRMPPEADEAFSRLRRSGRVIVRASRVGRVGVSPRAKLRVELRPRHSAEVEAVDVDCVINCTGPEADLGRVKSPLIDSLLKEGARLDPLRMGLQVNPDTGAVVDASGRESKNLFALGSLRRGALWETTAVPELSAQARRLAEDLLARVEGDPG